MRQHTIPRCYLSEWCDPASPFDQEPYVWVWAKGGKTKKKRSPKNTFVETDMYSMKLPGGDQDITIEQSFSGIEDTFVRLLRTKIGRQIPLTDEEKALICVFAAIMSIRTKERKGHFERFYLEIHTRFLEMDKCHNAQSKATLEMKILSDYAHQFTIAQVRVHTNRDEHGG